MLKIILNILDILLLLLLNVIAYTLLMVGVLLIYMAIEGIPLEVEYLNILFNWNLVVIVINVIVFYILQNNIKVFRRSVHEFLDDLEVRLETKLQKLKVEQERLVEEEKLKSFKNLKKQTDSNKVLSTHTEHTKIIPREEDDKVEKVDFMAINLENTEKIDKKKEE